MAIDGIWKITVNSPMGIQEGTLNLATNGSTLTGTQTGALGTQNAVLCAIDLFGAYRYLIRKKADG